MPPEHSRQEIDQRSQSLGPKGEAFQVHNFRNIRRREKKRTRINEIQRLKPDCIGAVYISSTAQTLDLALFAPKRFPTADPYHGLLTTFGL